MRQRLFFSAFLVSTLGAQAFGQRVGDPIVSSVLVTAPQNYVIAARTLQLSTRALNPRGALLRNRAFQYAVSDSLRASISDTGLLRGLQVGPVDVTVTETASGVASVQRYYIYPDKVSIASSVTSLQVGETSKLAIQLQDADGKTLAPVPVQWSTDLPTVGKVAPDGTLSALAEGRTTVGATLDMGPGFSHFSAYLPFQVVRLSDYKIRPLVTSLPSTSTVTTIVPTRVSSVSGYVAAITSLSNGGQAAVLWQGGKTQTIVATGMSVNSRVISQLVSVSVNTKGDVAVLASVEAEWCGQLLLLYTAASKYTAKVLDDVNGCPYYIPSAQSLDATDGIVYYNFSRNALLYRKLDGTIQTVLAVGDKPTGAGAVSSVANWNFTPYDNLVIEASISGSPLTWLAWDHKTVAKLFALGATVGSLTVDFARLPREVAPGEFITRMGGSNWSSISKFKNGTFTILVQNGNGTTQPGWINDNFDGAEGTVYFVGDRSVNGTTRRSVYVNQNGTNTFVGDYGLASDVSQVNAIDGNRAIVWGTQDTGLLTINQYVGTAASSIIPSGTTIEIKPGPAIARSSVPRGVGSAPIYRTNGDSLYQVQAGTASTLLKPGDTLAGAKVSAVQNLAGAPAGNIALIAQTGAAALQGIFTYRNGQFSKVVYNGDLISGATVYGAATNDGLLATNSQGHVAAFLYMSTVNGVYYFAAPTVRNIVSPGDGVPGTSLRINSVSQVAIDESDRIAIMANLSNGKAGILLWDKGTLREIFEVGQNDPLGRPFTYFSNLYAAGGKFYLSGGVSGSNEHLSLDGSTIALMATNGQTTTTGIALTGVLGGQLAANTKGDFAFQSITAQGQALFVRRAGSKDTLVAIGSRQGPDGEWFLQIFGAGLSDQGDVVFSALVWQNGITQVKLYQATPQN